MSDEDTWPPEYLLEWALNGCEGPAPESPPGYEPSWERKYRLKLASRTPLPPTPMHKIRVERTTREILGWPCASKYQSTCRCGWYGDNLKSMVEAQKQAEWHTGTKLDQVTGWS